MSSNSVGTIDWLLKKTEQTINDALKVAEKSNKLSDENFKACFFQAICNRLNETFNRFQIESLFDENKKQQNELKSKPRPSSKDKQPESKEKRSSKRSGHDSKATKPDNREKHESEPDRSRERRANGPESGRSSDLMKHGSKSKPSERKRKMNSSRSSGTDRSASSEPTTLQLRQELRQQLKLRFNIIVKNIANSRRANLLEIFLTLCDLIGANVRASDVNSISRSRYQYSIIVELSSSHVKRNILECISGKNIMSGDVVTLPKQLKSKKVEIYAQLTPFYLNMDIIAYEAKQNGLIFSRNMTSKGMMIKRTQNSGPNYFLSQQTLEKYLDNSIYKKYRHH